MNTYLVTEASCMKDLVAQVNVLISDGYVPQGGLSEVMTDNGVDTVYGCAQAMYKPPTQEGE